MSNIPPHFWLEMLPAGIEAQSVRTLRVEDREFLAAVGSRPIRVLDVFRRLRWPESQAFQEALNRLVIRGWLVAREQLEPSTSPTQEAPDATGEESLLALLARYAQDGPEDEETDSVKLDSMGDRPSSWSAEARAATEDRLDVSQGATSPSTDEFFQAPSLEGEAESLPSQSADEPAEDDGPKPWELLPPSPPPSEEDAADLLAAMGLSPGLAAKPSAPAPAPPPSRQTEFPGHDGLLKALLRGSPLPDIDPVVDVPAYGMGPAASPSPPAPDDFVRLRDIGATVGPGDGPPSSPSEPAPVVRPIAPRPAAAPAEPMSERSRRRHEDRQRMLESARRERAQRDEARERAEKMRIQKQVAAEERERTLKHQRALEEAARGSTFLSRAERARRIRDGVPPKSKDD